MYTDTTLHAWGMVIVVTAALILLNEFTRRWKWAAILCFIVLPIILTVFVWPNTTSDGSTAGAWFYYVKVYSALAGCIGFMIIRYSKKLSQNKYALLFPPFILALNILEAVIRDFEAFSFPAGITDGLWIMGGPWNIMNGIAGIINIITITGWMGIYISKNKTRDMVWPDMLWFWIIAYDLWNFAYCYNLGADYSAYTGLALLLSCTIPAFFLSKGAWLQHRAHTLGLYMMFRITFPDFAKMDLFAIPGSQDPRAYFAVSFVALAFNIGVLVYEIYKIGKTKRNPLKAELYTDLSAYKKNSLEERLGNQ